MRGALLLAFMVAGLGLAGGGVGAAAPQVKPESAGEAAWEVARRHLRLKDPVKALAALRAAKLDDPARPQTAAVLALAAAGAGQADLARRAWDTVRRSPGIPPLARLALDAHALEVCATPCRLGARPADEVRALPLTLQAAYLSALSRVSPGAAAPLARALASREALVGPAPLPERAGLLAAAHGVLDAAGDRAGAGELVALAWELFPHEPAVAFLVRVLDDGAMLEKLGLERGLTRLENLSSAHRNAAVVQWGTALCGDAVVQRDLPCPALPRPQGCRATFAVGKALRQVRRHEEAEGALVTVARGCPELTERALFLGARAAIAQLGGGARAVPLLLRLAQEYPGSTLADDALVLAGETLARVDDVAGARRNWERAEREFPTGDLAPQATWWLAWGDVEAGRTAAARERLAAAASREGDAAARLRAAYWLARLAESPADRIAGLERLVAREPLSVEAALARGVLQAEGTGLPDPPVIQRVPAPPPVVPTDVASAAGLLLARLGMDEDAAAFLRQALQAPGLAPGADLHLCQRLAGTGDAASPSRWVRKHHAQALGGPPTSWTMHLLGLAYPRAHAQAIHAAAEAEQLPATLLFALAREESAFDHTATSLSGAVGLFQLVPATALTEALSLRLPVRDEAALRDPDLNARLGASYLARNLRQFQGSTALALAAYNAGPGMAQKWKARRMDGPLDAFMESIPIGETRDYVRRVLHSHAVYAFLEGEGPLVLPVRLLDPGEAATSSGPR
jgi:soluble lytic murein transglycosylase-like protein